MSDAITKAAKQAREALELYACGGTEYRKHAEAAIASIDAALSQAGQGGHDREAFAGILKRSLTAEHLPAVEAIMWCFDAWAESSDLHAAQPAPVASVAGTALCPTIESLLTELLAFAEVDFNKLEGGIGYFVSVKPKGRGALWWYDTHGELRTALQECRKKAVALKFIKE